jgi:hypothetical protein
MFEGGSAEARGASCCSRYFSESSGNLGCVGMLHGCLCQPVDAGVPLSTYLRPVLRTGTKG